MITPFRISISCGALLLSISAHAQPLEEIIVRGELRDVDLRSAPASISVLSSGDLERRSATHLEDVMGLAANVNLASGASRARYFQIRGIGERGQFVEPLNPSVGVLVDGADVSTVAGAATLFDVEQIEVFRGPQGTRYGANALAGLINVRTRAPTEELEGRLNVDLSSYDSATIAGALSGPLADRLTGRLALQSHRSDGFMQNTYLGTDDTNARDELSVRGKLHWAPTSDLTIASTVGVVRIDNGYDAFSLDNDRYTRSDEPGRDALDAELGVIDAAWEPDARFAVHALVSAALSDATYGYDEDWTYVGFDPAGYASTDYYFRDRRTTTEELRVSSTDAGRLFGGSTDWAAGLYAMQSDDDLRRVYTFAAAPFESDFEIDRHAVFGQLDAALAGGVGLTAGVRLERHRSRYRDSADVAFAPSDDLIGWRLGVDREFGRNMMAYALFAGGYKAGGFNTDGTLDEDLRVFEPETTTNIEIGAKGVLAAGRVDLRIALFHMQRDDVQIASSVTRVRADGSAEFIDYIGNAATGTNYGIETEIVFEATEKLIVSGSAGLLRARYDSFVNAAGENLDGREQAHAPSYQLAADLRYAVDAHWYIEGGLEARDAFYFSASHNERSRAYTVLNAAVGYAGDAWSLRFWGRNLTDDETYVRGYYFGNDPRLDYAPRGYTQLGEPRRIGVSYTRDF